ncbi:MAG: hypothetical protein GY822_22045 [Deltaproteobacteria bacterium]|nr:hypothetical protein [Deltaproteobacteria bacterium]
MDVSYVFAKSSCPECGHKGRYVPAITLEHLLVDEAIQGGEAARRGEDLAEILQKFDIVPLTDATRSIISHR